MFPDINVSQGSVATYARSGGIFNNQFTVNLPGYLVVKNLGKSVKIRQNYGRGFVASLFAHPVDLSRQTSVPEYLSQHITTRSSTRSLRSSSAPLLHVPFRRTYFGKRSFSTAAPSVWNSLPVSVQNCDTLTLFKSRLKAHLFSSVYAS